MAAVKQGNFYTVTLNMQIYETGKPERQQPSLCSKFSVFGDKNVHHKHSSLLKLIFARKIYF